ERVAVMAVARCRIPAVCHFVPDLVGDELVLRLERPVAVATGVAAVNALHFLEKKDIGGETAQPVAKLVDHHAPREVREALVDVVGGDGEAHGYAASVSNTRSNAPIVAAVSFR